MGQTSRDHQRGSREEVEEILEYTINQEPQFFVAFRKIN